MNKNTKKIEIKSRTFTQSRNWCFTDFELLDYQVIYEKYQDIIRYIGYGLEIYPKTKKQHFQGWIQFVNKKRMGGVKKILSTKKIHLESCRGNEIENKSYCSKDKKYTSFGAFVIQGQRTDLEAIKKIINTGNNLEMVAERHFGDFIRYHTGFAKYKKIVDKRLTKKFRQLDVTVICGPTGTNKTRQAVEKNPDAFKITGSNLKWFDGYDMEETLIIDEYNNDIPITQLLNLLDGYQLRLEIKGSHTYANWKKVIITTNLRPEQLHQKAKIEHIKAMNRRISQIINLFPKVL